VTFEGSTTSVRPCHFLALILGPDLTLSFEDVAAPVFVHDSARTPGGVTDQMKPMHLHIHVPAA
jgi:hypothetical protein